MSFIKTKDAKGMLNRHWLIWIPDDNGWVLTYSEPLAKKAKRKGWGCIEYRAYESPDEQKGE